MSNISIEEIAPGSPLSPAVWNGLIGAYGFRALNMLVAADFDDDTNIPVGALATPNASFMWTRCNHGRASAAAGSSFQLSTMCPVLEWSQLVTFSAVSRLPSMSVTGVLQVYRSCAHLGTNLLIASLPMTTAHTVYSSTPGTSVQLHAGDVLFFKIYSPGAALSALTDLCIGLRFKRNPIP